MDDGFDEAGGIAGRWLDVAPGASLGAGSPSAPRPARSSRQRAHAPAASPAAPPLAPAPGGVVSASAAGATQSTLAAMCDHDETALATMLDGLTQQQLETLAALVRDTLFLRRATPAPEAPPAPAPARTAPQQARAPQRTPPRSKPSAAPSPSPSSGNRGSDEELDELDGGLAGKWLQVPPGGTLPGAEPRAAPPPAKPAAAPPKKPPRQNVADLD